MPIPYGMIDGAKGKPELFNLKNLIMSYGANTQVACPNFQSNLKDYFETCGSGMLREDAPFLQFLTSEVNRSGLQQLIRPGNGKRRDVELKYWQRIPESEVKENQSNPNCVATERRGNCVETYTIDTDDNVQIGELIDHDHWADACTSNPELFNETIMRLVNAVMEKVATKTMEQSQSLIGKWGSRAGDIDGSSVNAQDQFVVRTTKTGDPETVAPYAWGNIDLATQMSRYCQRPIIFSGSSLYQYARRSELGCCYDTGLDLGEVFRQRSMPIAWDRRVEDVYGDQHNAIITQVGALTLLWYTKSNWVEGIREFQLARDFYAERISDPVTGLPLDLNIKNDCGQVSVSVTATTKLVSLPDDMYPTGDPLYDGVKYFNEILVDNS